MKKSNAYKAVQIEKVEKKCSKHWNKMGQLLWCGDGKSEVWVKMEDPAHTYYFKQVDFAAFLQKHSKVVKNSALRTDLM
jgi:hypothetical protein